MASMPLIWIIFLVYLLLPVDTTTFKRPVSEYYRPQKHTKLEKNVLTEFRKINIKVGEVFDRSIVKPFYGHGGPYGAVAEFASKKHIIESDHAPHYTLLEYLNDDQLLKAPQHIRDMIMQRKFLRAEIINIQTKITDLQKEICATNSDNSDSYRKQQDLQRENENLVRAKKALNNYNLAIKNSMGVLSIPYHIHRSFPSTGKPKNDITDLKDADQNSAKIAMEKYHNEWTIELQKGIENGFLKIDDKFVYTDEVNGKSKQIYDYEKIWEHNFDNIVKFSYEVKTAEVPKPVDADQSPRQQEMKHYMDKLYSSYRDKFLTTSIYFIKTPEDGYSRLLGLYVSEYELHLRKDFDSYKIGIQNQIEASKKFGWVNEDGVTKLKKLYQLDAVDTVYLPDNYKIIDYLIQRKAEKFRPPSNVEAYDDKLVDKLSETFNMFCSTSRRKRNAAKNSCIFHTDGNDDTKNNPKDPNKRPSTNLDDFDDMLKTQLGTDTKTVLIDSQRLNAYLLQLDSGDFVTARIKESLVEYVSKNSEKLTGTPEDISLTKSLLKIENLVSHSEQVSLAKVTVGGIGSDITNSKLSNFDKVKISTSKIATKISSLTSTTNKVGDSYGKIMLAKGFVSALRHGDFESLALMSGRVGLDFALEGIEKVGTLIAKKATTKFASKLGSKVLGKMAGPVGAVADIGISAYSLAKSIKVLKDPNATRYDQNDAIADIVADSIDIAITAVSAVLSLVFPPLAPLFGAVAFIINIISTVVVGLFKAANHVSRLHDQIPLLDYEKKTEFLNRLTGDDTSGYIQDLIDTKSANNIAVNMTVQFLKENPNYIGRVFQSKTMYDPEASCELQEKKCHKIFFFTVKCSNWYRVSYCNGHNGYCNGKYSSTRCQSHNKHGFTLPVAGFYGQNYKYQCKCGPDPPPQWGFDIPNNVIDFSRKRSVYLQRAAPDFSLGSNFEYLCKPSSIYNEGPRVSNTYTSTAFLCKGAIGVTRKRREGTFMWYDLGNGTDRVTLNPNEQVDNLFTVSNGTKNYYGNAGDDTFVFSGCSPLYGTFDGKGYRSLGNTVVLQPNCRFERNIEINLNSQILKFSNQASAISLRNIHRIFGRKDAADTIFAACNTKLIVDEGGRSSRYLDVVKVPSCGKSFELVVSVKAKNTVIDASRFTNGKLNVLIQAPLSMVSNIPLNFPGTIQFQFDSNVRDLLSAVIENSTSSITLKFSNGGTCKFNFIGISKTEKANLVCGVKASNNQASIILKDNWNMTRQLSYDLNSEKLQSIFRLERNTYGYYLRQNGYNFLDNVFYLESGNWLVKGGNLNNRFILTNSTFFGTIEGGKGQNALQVSNNLNDVTTLMINLPSGFISGKRTIAVKNIQSIYGRSLYTEHVRVSNQTRYLNLGGEAKDYVQIPSLSSGIELTISAKGSLVIEDRKSNGSVIVQASFEEKDPCSLRLPLNLSVKNLGGGQMIIVLNYPAHKVMSASLIEIILGDSSFVSINGSFPFIYFEEDYNLQSSLVTDNGNILGVHELTNVGSLNNSTERLASDVLMNVFYLIGGIHWKVIGGKLDDTFILTDARFNGTVDGGQGVNSLIIGEEILGKVFINSNVIKTENSSKTTSFIGIHEIHGRSSRPENVTVTCEIKHVSLSGGQIDNFDIISIPKLGCSANLTVVAKGYTMISSVIEKTNSDVYLLPDELNRLNFEGNLSVTEATVINFPIQYPSYKLREYEVSITKEDQSKIVKLNLTLLENLNSIQLNIRFDSDELETQKDNVNIMFVDEEFNSNGNLFLNIDTEEIYIVHVLEQGEFSRNETRKGAIGAKNFFRLHSGTWLSYGGKMDDSFILNDLNFTGSIHGLGGVNSLIVSESVNGESIIIDLINKRLKTSNHSVLNMTDIQVIGGRKQKQEKVICTCDTKLVMLEGGASIEFPDEIEVQDRFCNLTTTFILDEFTIVENNATQGNFTYNIKATKNFDVTYKPTNKSNHSFKFETSMEDFKYIAVEQSSVRFGFQDCEKSFPINSQNHPSFQISESPELISEVYMDSIETPQLSIVASSPFSSNVVGINGIVNVIVVDTWAKIQSVVGGDKDDTIFLRQVNSTKLVDGREGSNRLELIDDLYKGQSFDVDLNLNKITFSSNSSKKFVEAIKNIQLFTGRTSDFERIILGCDTRNIRYVDEITVTKNCAYDVHIELEVNTRVIFKPLEDEVLEARNEISIENDTLEMEDDELEDMELLNTSTFFYHFSSIHSFDIEVDKFARLSLTKHIFYLNFTLSDLNKLQFSLENLRLIYTTEDNDNQEFSHKVGMLDNTELFYSQPQFMTSEGFLLRITRYGEILAVFANPAETLTISEIQDDFIPRLSLYASKLGISFMLETGSDFIYCGSPTEVDWITNRETVTSHLIGFNQTTYEILDLDHDVFIYPQFIRNDSMHVVDLSDIVHQIRNKTQYKYVPTVKEAEENLEIVMSNWTDLFHGRIILVNGTKSYKAFAILLNSITMEILPSKANNFDNEQIIWKISPRPIVIPDGYTYLFAGQDLEDGIKISTETKNDNSSSEYTRDGNNLMMMNMNSDEDDSGLVTSFGIFDYFPQPNIRGRKTVDAVNDQLETIDLVQNIQVRLGKETVSVTSHEPLVTMEVGNMRFRKQHREISIQSYDTFMNNKIIKITQNSKGLTLMNKEF